MKTRLIASLACLPLPFLLGAASGPATLDVTVTGLKHTRGALLACVWKDKGGFPTCQKSKTAVRQTVKITGTSMKVRFTGMATGSYGVSIHHDEDGDGKLKTNFIGMPKEGVGISNNPGGIPSWSKAQLTIGPGSATSITMRYL
jgi:uncharacterized protein (DUF2141 family)